MSEGFFITVPATAANLGPGFDVLGLALDLRMLVWARKAASWSVKLSGQGAELLARDEQNLMVQACISGMKERAGEISSFALTVENYIPISRGLGSSATAIVAGLALAQLAGGKLDRDLLFRQAAAYEHHPDNVAPAIYGGLRVCGNGTQGFTSQPAKVHPRIRLLVIIPEQAVSTQEMRDLLPSHYSEEVQAANLQARTHLLEALASGEPAGLRYSEADRIHQPYRLDAQPQSKQAFGFLSAHPEVAGAFLSGSGATVAGWLVNSADPTADIRQQLSDAGIAASIKIIAVDYLGLFHEAF